MNKIKYLTFLLIMVVISSSVSAWDANRVISGNDVTLTVTPGDGFNTFTITETITDATINPNSWGAAACGLAGNRLTCDGAGDDPITISYITTGSGTVSGEVVGVNTNTWASETNVPTGDTDVSVVDAPPQCTGADPSNAVLCAGDDAGLDADTAKTLVAACDAAKCEYICSVGFHLDGGACVADAFSCTGDDPSNAVLCAGDDAGLDADTAKTLVAACDAAKCEYECDGGFHLDGGACVADAGDDGDAAECGNNAIEAPEQCDDGNGNNNDGCSSTCTLEEITDEPTLIKRISIIIQNFVANTNTKLKKISEIALAFRESGVLED